MRQIRFKRYCDRISNGIQVSGKCIFVGPVAIVDQGAVIFCSGLNGVLGSRASTGWFYFIQIALPAVAVALRARDKLGNCKRRLSLG